MTPLWLIFVLVAVTAAIGALVRHALSVVGPSESIPVRRRITVVNTLGAFGAGALLAVNGELAVILATGFFGSLTTFSTLAVWMASDFSQGKPMAAFRVVFVHFLLGIPAVWGGFLLSDFLL